MSGLPLTRRTVAVAGLAGLAGLVGLASPGLVRAQAPPSFTTSDQRQGLLIVPVMINDRGPYAFAIDSAANTSVIARDLVAGLMLPDAGEVTMHTLVAGERAPTVRAGRVRTGALNARDIRLVVAGRHGLSGLDGLLGTDLLAGLRLVLHFGRRTRVDVTRPRRWGDHAGDGQRLNARSASAGEQRFNGLLMIDASARSIPCKVIIDTGARMTVINTALAREAGAQPLVLPDGTTVSRVLSPTGRDAMAEAMLLPELRLGGISLTRVPVLVGDFHTFAIWGLADQPAALLGVDLLGLFQTVIIDLKRGELVLDP
ncbi:aspartyl protease family protein [Brevundimonas sp.]|uniref:aspartyl protease family protein n=1 Tax=Brevundimonas sp. TaxID=1871086 RepID=UPI002FCB037A